MVAVDAILPVVVLVKMGFISTRVLAFVFVLLEPTMLELNANNVPTIAIPAHHQSPARSVLRVTTSTQAHAELPALMEPTPSVMSASLASPHAKLASIMPMSANLASMEPFFSTTNAARNVLTTTSTMEPTASSVARTVSTVSLLPPTVFLVLLASSLLAANASILAPTWLALTESALTTAQLVST